MKFLLLFIIILYSCMISIGCKNKSSHPSAQKDSIKLHAPVVDTLDKARQLKAPVINIEDTVTAKQFILYTKDSATNMASVSKKIETSLSGTLLSFLKANKMKATGPPMAWYKTRKAPYFFEIGFPVAKKPAKLSKNIFTREIGADSALVAHFFGPYEITGIAYEALQERLSSQNRKAIAIPYEIYVSDPIDEKGNVKNPYKVQTDIVMPYKKIK